MMTKLMDLSNVSMQSNTANMSSTNNKTKSMMILISLHNNKTVDDTAKDIEDEAKIGNKMHNGSFRGNSFRAGSGCAHEGLCVDVAFSKAHLTLTQKTVCGVMRNPSRQ
ncbi:hypothetical protein DPMN_059833 [Dreissena polymorpha]|uniref:Uncharacterized protein n=1 Tax=Dreissena polymorpha TaxID=45954 RepID=A0A9D4C443_DREPO|nr:hypothetical protein DPMN_059833 [Dreissena polymorpha]